MNRHRIDVNTARAVVEARLERQPQDAIEAGVVLEAWGGMTSADALNLGRQVVAESRSRPHEARPQVSYSLPRERYLSLGLGLVLTLFTLATWSIPLSWRYEPQVVSDTLRLALPITMAFQGGLRRRYLARRGGLATMRPDGKWVLTGAAVGSLLLGLTLGTQGWLAAFLSVTWVGGSLLVARRWVWQYTFLALAVTVPLFLSVPPMPVLLLAAVAMCVLVRGAIVSEPERAHHPGPWLQVIIETIIGAFLGLMLVLDDSVGYGMRNLLPAVTLLPSAVGVAWGGIELSELWRALPESLEGHSVFERNLGSRRWSGESILLKALSRVVLTSVVLGTPIFISANWFGGSKYAAMRLLIGFGAYGIVSLLAGLLSSLGYSPWVLAATAFGVGMYSFVDPSFSAGGLIIVSITVLILLLIPAMIILRRPARALATRMMIA
ncbi:MAG: hypothetical protein KAZ88_00380 [Acidimicrobiia bacterium]|jgi:hypothetical protein|nr:hypothetical protein [Acidimicrobiia bacterium]MBP8179433.1 hypothetical protein [Acidimicrobiia bacterium]